MCVCDTKMIPSKWQRKNVLARHFMKIVFKISWFGIDTQTYLNFIGSNFKFNLKKNIRMSESDDGLNHANRFISIEKETTRTLHEIRIQNWTDLANVVQCFIGNKKRVPI